MKATGFFAPLIFLFTVACANNNSVEATKENINAKIKDTIVAIAPPVPDSFKVGKVIDSVICKADASQSYALYIPAKGNKEALPVIYFF